MWTSKVGATAKPLLLSLTNNGVLMDFADITNPVFRMRLRSSETGWVEFEVTAYDDTENVPARYNAQVVFGDWSEVTEGVYIGEVDATINGDDVSFPDDGYITLKFLGGVNQ